MHVQARLLMCYAATHPEKMDAQKQVQWQKLAKLQAADMNTIINLEHLGVPVRKRGKASGLSFGRKRKRAVRKASHCLSRHQAFLVALTADKPHLYCRWVCICSCTVS